MEVAVPDVDLVAAQEGQAKMGCRVKVTQKATELAGSSSHLFIQSLYFCFI